MTRVSSRRPFTPTSRDIAARVIAMLREAPTVMVVFADGRMWVTHRSHAMDDERVVGRYQGAPSAELIERDIDKFLMERSK